MNTPSAGASVTRQRSGAFWLRDLPMRLMSDVRAVLGDPFRDDPEADFTFSLTRDERRRRSALLRLMIAAVTIFLTLFALPLTILTHSGLAVIVPIFLDIVVGIFCLWLSAREHIRLAGFLYTYGLIALLALSNYEARALDLRVVLIYSLMSVYILIAGMVLPRWAIVPTTLVIIGICIVGVLRTPLAPGMAGTLTPMNLKSAAVGTLISIHILTGTITTISARSASAGLRAAARVADRERELAALKDQFIVDANHELRTPIMSLYGNIELLRTVGTGITDEQRERLVERALQSGDAVLRLLGSVLDTSVLESGTLRLHFRPLALAELVRQVLETFDPREIGEPGLSETPMSLRDVTVSIAPTLVVLADEGRLRQVLINLISNALKYSPPGSPIMLAARVQAVAHGRRLFSSGVDHTAMPTMTAHISVRDAGLGVPPSEATMLFNRFVRLPRDIAGPVRGTGVGLYLCRILVDAMGGRIWVESSGVPGEGSTFNFTLPLAPATPVVPTNTLPNDERASVANGSRQGE